LDACADRSFRHASVGTIAQSRPITLQQSLVQPLGLSFRASYHLDIQKHPIYLLFSIITSSKKYFRSYGYAKTFSIRPDEK